MSKVRMGTLVFAIPFIVLLKADLHFEKGHNHMGALVIVIPLHAANRHITVQENERLSPGFPYEFLTSLFFLHS